MSGGRASRLPKWTSLGILILFFALSPFSLAQVEQHLKTQGPFGQVATGDTLGEIMVRVDTLATEPGAPAEVSLAFDSTQFDPSTNTFTSIFGSGYIPKQALTGDGGKQLTLDVDTSAIPGFSTTLCVFSLDSSECAPNPGGLISVNWHKTDLFSRSFSGDFTATSFNLLFHSVGAFSDTTASAEGSFIGKTFLANDPGDFFTTIGVTHETDVVTLQHKH